jgi:NAD(P)-dependent dehydrogenase (short-subunit alcohol dehydrogenase family)
MNIAISGTNSGIGAALVHYIRTNFPGSNIYGFDQSLESVWCNNTDGHSTIYQIQAKAQADGWDQILAAAQSRGHQIYNLVNCAGVNALDMIPDVEDVDLDSIIDTNVKGYIKGVRAAARLGSVKRIINIGSIAGTRPMRGSLVYCASKAAVDMITKQAARELAPHTAVYGLNPGRLEGTAMTRQVDEDILRVRNWTPEEALRYQLQYIPMRRYGDLKEVMAVMHYLLCDAPMFQTGDIIELAGGQ